MSARQTFSETDTSSPSWYPQSHRQSYSGQKAPHSTPLALYNDRNTSYNSVVLSKEKEKFNANANSKEKANTASPTPASLPFVGRRKPVQNPFEKFPKGEFDAWIEDLKGALKKARGEEAEVEVEVDWEEPRSTAKSIRSGSRAGSRAESKPRSTTTTRMGTAVQKQAFGYPDETPVHPTRTFRPFLPPGREGNEEDEEVNDSFADVVARRKGKGKARDPREGPGLMAARRTSLAEEPTLILSSDEEDEAEVSRLTIGDLDSESESEEEEEEEEEEGDHEGDMLGDDAEDLVRGYAAQQRRAARDGGHDVVDLVDDEEDELQHSPPTRARSVQPPQYETYVEYDQEDDIGSEEEQEEEYERAQPLVEDTSFPPHTGTDHKTKLELKDTWKQARTFAEDLYTGGDVILEEKDERRDPSRLVGTSGVDEDEEEEEEEVRIEKDDRVEGEEEEEEEDEEKGFLTPGVLTPRGQHVVVDSDVDVDLESAELEHEHEHEHEYEEEEEYGDEREFESQQGERYEEEREGEGEHEEWLEDEEEEEEPHSPQYSIVPPGATHHHYPPTTGRGDPIPEDAEIIELDDSEDENEKEDEESDARLAEEERERALVEEDEDEDEDEEKEDEERLFPIEEVASDLSGAGGEGQVRKHPLEQDQEQDEQLVTPTDTEDLFESKSVDVEYPSQVVEPTGDEADDKHGEVEEEEVIVIPGPEDAHEPEPRHTQSRAFDAVPITVPTLAHTLLDPSALFQPPPPIFSQLSMDSLFDMDAGDGILEGLVQESIEALHTSLSDELGGFGHGHEHSLALGHGVMAMEAAMEMTIHSHLDSAHTSESQLENHPTTIPIDDYSAPVIEVMDDDDQVVEEHREEGGEEMGNDRVEEAQEIQELEEIPLLAEVHEPGLAQVEGPEEIPELEEIHESEPEQVQVQEPEQAQELEQVEELELHLEQEQVQDQELGQAEDGGDDTDIASSVNGGEGDSDMDEVTPRPRTVPLPLSVPSSGETGLAEAKDEIEEEVQEVQMEEEEVQEPGPILAEEAHEPDHVAREMQDHPVEEVQEAEGMRETESVREVGEVQDYPVEELDGGEADADFAIVPPAPYVSEMVQTQEVIVLDDEEEEESVARTPSVVSEALEADTAMTTAAVQEDVAEVSQSPEKDEDEERAEETLTPPVPALDQHSHQNFEDERIEDEEGDEDALSVPDDEYHPLRQEEDHQDQEQDRKVDAVEIEPDVVEVDQVDEEVDELLSSSPLSSPPVDGPKALPQTLGEDGQMDREFESGSGFGGLFTPLEGESGAVSASSSEALSTGDLSALESREKGDEQVHGHDQDQEAFEDGLIDWDQVEGGQGLDVKEDKPVVEEKVEEKETAEEPTVSVAPPPESTPEEKENQVDASKPKEEPQPEPEPKAKNRPGKRKRPTLTPNKNKGKSKTKPGAAGRRRTGKGVDGDDDYLEDAPGLGLGVIHVNPRGKVAKGKGDVEGDESRPSTRESSIVSSGTSELSTAPPSPISRPVALPRVQMHSEPFIHAHGSKKKGLIGSGLRGKMPVADASRPRVVTKGTTGKGKAAGGSLDALASPTSTLGQVEVETPKSTTSTSVQTPKSESAQSLPTILPSSTASTPNVKQQSLTTTPSHPNILKTYPSPTVKPLALSSAVHSSPRHTPLSNSPVTRSHCRYHRISIPKSEDGPRVMFLVPGCSLNDRELMEEEEIEDHGDATYEDSQRLVRDIEKLDFDSYLLGVIRQLVGLDIMREGEVFYLAQEGDGVGQKVVKPRTSHAKRRRSSPSGTVASGSVGSPLRPPVSLAGSTSTTHSLLAGRVAYDDEEEIDDDDGLSSLAESDSEDEDAVEGHVSKKARTSSAAGDDVEVDGTTTTMGVPGKRKRAVDAEYDPTRDAGEGRESSDDDDDKIKGKKTRRGVKRARKEKEASDGDGKSKKRSKSKSRKSKDAGLGLTKTQTQETLVDEPVEAEGLPAEVPPPVEALQAYSDTLAATQTEAEAETEIQTQPQEQTQTVPTSTEQLSSQQKQQKRTTNPGHIPAHLQRLQQLRPLIPRPPQEPPVKMHVISAGHAHGHYGSSESISASSSGSLNKSQSVSPPLLGLHPVNVFSSPSSSPHPPPPPHHHPQHHPMGMQMPMPMPMTMPMTLPMGGGPLSAPGFQGQNQPITMTHSEMSMWTSRGWTAYPLLPFRQPLFYSGMMTPQQQQQQQQGGAYVTPGGSQGVYSGPAESQGTSGAGDRHGHGDDEGGDSGGSVHGAPS